MSDSINRGANLVSRGLYRSAPLFGKNNGAYWVLWGCISSLCCFLFFFLFLNLLLSQWSVSSKKGRLNSDYENGLSNPYSSWCLPLDWVCVRCSVYVCGVRDNVVFHTAGRVLSCGRKRHLQTNTHFHVPLLIFLDEHHRTAHYHFFKIPLGLASDSWDENENFDKNNSLDVQFESIWG